MVQSYNTISWNDVNNEGSYIYQNVDSNPMLWELIFFIDQSLKFVSCQIEEGRHLAFRSIEVFNAVDK